MLGEIVGRVWLLEPAAAWFLSDICQGASDSPIPRGLLDGKRGRGRFCGQSRVSESPIWPPGYLCICWFMQRLGLLGGPPAEALVPLFPSGSPLHSPLALDCAVALFKIGKSLPSYRTPSHPLGDLAGALPVNRNAIVITPNGFRTRMGAQLHPIDRTALLPTHYYPIFLLHSLSLAVFVGRAMLQLVPNHKRHFRLFYFGGSQSMPLGGPKRPLDNCV